MYQFSFSHFQTLIFLPGVQTASLFGMLGVGVVPGALLLPATIYAGMKFSKFIAILIEDIFDEFQYDIDTFKCPECDEIGNHKKYREGGKNCMNTNCSVGSVVIKSKL